MALAYAKQNFMQKKKTGPKVPEEEEESKLGMPAIPGSFKLASKSSGASGGKGSSNFNPSKPLSLSRSSSPPSSRPPIPSKKQMPNVDDEMAEGETPEEDQMEGQEGEEQEMEGEGQDQEPEVGRYSTERAGFRREGEACGNCQNYKPESGTCTMVAETDISPEDTCGSFYEPMGDEGQEPGEATDTGMGSDMGAGVSGGARDGQRSLYE